MPRPDAGDAVLRTARRRALVDEWALVLAAEGLHALVSDGPDGFALAVPADEAARAAAVLAAWERENRPSAPTPPEPIADPHALRHALAVAAALVVFFLVTRPGGPRAAWSERGAADAARIAAGELWRAVTALTLHADLAHLGGNAAAGTLFGSGVARALGPGLGLALVVAAGASGNLVNAWAHGGDHVSLGASTAVFGAAGILVGLAAARRRRRAERRPWTPVAAGLALLAMLGTGGERVDLWAHGFGLGAGAALGLALGLARLRDPPGRPAQLALGALAALTVLGAWALALSAPQGP